MGNGHSIDDVFDVKGSLYECGGDQLSLDELSARTVEDNKAVTVFHYTAAPKFRDVLSICYKYSRVLRHPKLLKVFSCTLSSGGSGLTVVTEPARPLSALLADGKAAIAVLHPAELAWQLHGVLEALVFLHNQGQVSHNNVGEQSVFVTVDGTWKLGRLECVYPLASAAAAESGLTASSGLEYLGKVSALVSTGRVPGDGGPPGVGNDVYGFSKLFERLKDRLTDVGADAVEDFEERLTALIDEGSGLTPAGASVPALPSSLSSLLDHAIFSTEFQQVASFLSELCLKPEESKTAFFRSLLPRLRALPPDLVARCLVKRLLTRFIVLNQTAKRLVLPALFAPRWTPDELEQVGRLNPIARRRHCSCHACAVVGVLPVSEFGTSVLVLALKLLRLHDVEARSLVLEHFHAFCALFDVDCLRTVVMPLVVRCLRDSSQALTSLALHALADMVPLLGIETVFRAQFCDDAGGSFPLFSSRLQQPAAVASAGAVLPRELQVQTSRLPASALASRSVPAVQSDDESSGHLATADDASERHFGLPRSATDPSSKGLSGDSAVDHTERHARSKPDQSRRSGDDGGRVPAKAERTLSPPADRHIIHDSAFASSVGGSEDARHNRLFIKDPAHPSDSSRNIKNALRLGIRTKQSVAGATNLAGRTEAADATSAVLSASASGTDGEIASKLAASSTKPKGFDVDGLDIKSLTIKVAQEEVDYFADMAPALVLPPPGSKPPLPRFGEYGVVTSAVSSSEFAARTSPNPPSVADVALGASLAPSSARSKFESASLAVRNTNEVSGWDDGGWVDGDW